MVNSESLYALLAQRAQNQSARLQQLLLGINWTLAEIQPDNGANSVGLSFSPLDIPRNLPWSGSLAGRPVADVLAWMETGNVCELAIALATANAVINQADNALLRDALPLRCETFPHLAVFEHFAPQIRGSSVAIIGRYPNLDHYKKQFDFVCIERRPGPDDLPEAAASWALPRADWVFITASSIANRTLPQLLALSRNAKVVLMGPSLPWLADWAEFGVDFLAGTVVHDAQALRQIVAEAGGTRIFSQAVGYRLLALS